MKPNICPSSVPGDISDLQDVAAISFYLFLSFFYLGTFWIMFGKIEISGKENCTDNAQKIMYKLASE